MSCKSLFISETIKLDVPFPDGGKRMKSVILCNIKTPELESAFAHVVTQKRRPIHVHRCTLPGVIMHVVQSRGQIDTQDDPFTLRR